MSDSDISTSTRSSRSRSSTSRSRTASSTFSSTESEGGLDTTTTATFVPTTTPSATGLLTASVPVQTETTSSSSLSASTPISTTSTSDNSGAAGPPVAAIVVPTILGAFVIGAVAFFLIFRRRRRRRSSSGSPYITRHEPKRRDTHPQPTIQDSSLYLASNKEPENEKDMTPMSPSSSIDCEILRSPKSKLRSSRASSSIFIDDRDDVTISSRSNHFRPLSLGEPLTSRGLQSPTSATSQPTPLFDRTHSNRAVSDRQLPTIPGTPSTPRFAFFTPEEQDGEKLIAQVQPADVEIISLSRTTTRNSNRSSRSARSKTRNSTPPTPTGSLPPLSPPPPIPLPPLPGLSDHLAKRVSTNTLSAPSRPGFMDSRPVSMQSAYSVQTQRFSPNLSSSLSPDVLATLERLKKRISTPWSINSVDTYQFNKTTAPPTEEA
ncbi:hypothetical protein RHS04_09456 [Rhizoctonia solani]|uniref:Uncharacterized protein n=1 Tax=Rhizoctonia solani TaxID=456999 RepID=A0A8H7GXT1_9AGAM|nr:hypothetical protein RHS04_09456 [Rhizoctonia solani]